MKRGIILILLVLAGGCNTPFPWEHPQAPELWRTEPSTQPVSLEILSDPPGARIIVNGGYVGQSPCTIDVLKANKAYYQSLLHDENYDADHFCRKYRIEAIPVIPGYVQVRTFSSGDPLVLRYCSNEECHSRENGNPECELDINSVFCHSG